MKIFLILLLLSGICYAENEYLIREPSKSLTFSTGETYEYIIDAEGFRSLTPEEALNIATAIQLLTATSFDDELGKAILETFIPERFKVK